MTNTILAIDQGTTSSRAIVFDEDGNILDAAQSEFTQHFPADGWVEHDPEDIWQTTVATCREVLGRATQTPVAIGITNQRETTLVWDRHSGKAVYNAIVWQDRRTADQCQQLKAAGHEQLFTQKTGLLLDPYFSATKLAWILDNVAGARAGAENGDLLFGTVDTYLIWRLTQGGQHVSDATNASRTMMFDIEKQDWDDQLLGILNIPRSMLPDVRDCAADFGVSDESTIGVALPIAGVAGDQQAALIGQTCFEPGTAKSTYGTGCFAIINTGSERKVSSNRLLSTVGYRLGGEVTYALEGSIFVAGAAVQWLRDGLGVIENASDTETLARSLDNVGKGGNVGAAVQTHDNVYLVPAFTGLGAPYWDPHARGAMFGLTRDTGVAEFARATLDSVCYQTHDLLSAMTGDGVEPTTIRVDGGMVANDWVLQRLADLTGCHIQRPAVIETTALGAAYLAGLQCGIYSSLDELAQRWKVDHEATPKLDEGSRAQRLAGWYRAVRATQSFSAKDENGTC